ncbi:hypothetical protein ACFTWF_33880 [Rhodococcus sp. NPDC056960]|uniref:hypothetical protein n=1 Tax=Rhodococcus TaxID=1827 RepID=UPI0036291735
MKAQPHPSMSAQPGDLSADSDPALPNLALALADSSVDPHTVTVAARTAAEIELRVGVSEPRSHSS